MAKKIKWKKMNVRPYREKKNAQHLANTWRKGGFYARVRKVKKGYNVFRSVGILRKRKVRGG